MWCLRVGAWTGIWAFAAAQYILGSFLFNQTYQEGLDVLRERLQNHPDVEDIYYPNKYRLPTDFYVYKPPNRQREYTQNVIFDPCRGYEFNCCNDTYGTAEFEQVNMDVNDTAFGTRTRTYADGSALADEVSRRPDDELFIDETCEDEYLPEGRADCVMPRIARRPPRVMPRCWNWNESVVADQPCRAPADGSPVELCLEVGITQSAYVVECGGKAMTDPHCGTFLEIHRPGRADKLSETRLRGSYPSGYRMTIISTTYKRHSSRVICYDPIKQGNYEAWWVQRTFYNFIVERRIPFRVISPECDWDPQNNRFLPYATLGVARQLSGLDPKDPDRVLFSRKRVEGRPGFPGKGMGSTLVLPANDTWHSTAQFDAAAWHDFSTYTFTPEKPDYTVKSGRIEPSFAEQAAWALLQAERGYRRQLGEEEAGQGSGPGPGPSEEERG